MVEDQKLAQQLMQSRLINVSEEVLFPLFLKQQEEILDRMCGEFEAGKTEGLVGHVAKISYIRSVVWELRQKQKQGDRIAQKQNKEKK